MNTLALPALELVKKLKSARSGGVAMRGGHRQECK